MLGLFLYTIYIMRGSCLTLLTEISEESYSMDSEPQTAKEPRIGYATRAAAWRNNRLARGVAMQHLVSLIAPTRGGRQGLSESVTKLYGRATEPKQSVSLLLIPVSSVLKSWQYGRQTGKLSGMGRTGYSPVCSSDYAQRSAVAVR
jgi:hypothetical protein